MLCQQYISKVSIVAYVTENWLYNQVFQSTLNGYIAFVGSRFSSTVSSGTSESTS